MIKEWIQTDEQKRLIREGKLTPSILRYTQMKQLDPPTGSAATISTSLEIAPLPNRELILPEKYLLRDLYQVK